MIHWLLVKLPGYLYTWSFQLYCFNCIVLILPLQNTHTPTLSRMVGSLTKIFAGGEIQMLWLVLSASACAAAVSVSVACAIDMNGNKYVLCMDRWLYVCIPTNLHGICFKYKRKYFYGCYICICVIVEWLWLCECVFFLTVWDTRWRVEMVGGLCMVVVYLNPSLLKYHVVYTHSFVVFHILFLLFSVFRKICW